MLWGCMSASGVGVLQILEGKVDSQQYVDTISISVIPFWFEFNWGRLHFPARWMQGSYISSL